MQLTLPGFEASLFGVRSRPKVDYQSIVSEIRLNNWFQVTDETQTKQGVSL